MTTFRKIARAAFTGLLGMLLLAGLYFLMAFLLGLAPVNRPYVPAQDGILVYISSNGVHTDVVVPVRTRGHDWSSLIPRSQFRGVDSTFRYISFGWGDRAFYIETPTWADLTLKRALTSLFLPTPTVMHTEYFPGNPQGYLRQEGVILTETEYARLVSFIRSYFVQNRAGGFVLVPGAGYGPTDNFFEARGSYHLFRTSNSWTNQALKESGVRAAVWAPFDRAIFHQVRKAKQKDAPKTFRGKGQ